jgi:hypothetical protein
LLLLGLSVTPATAVRFAAMRMWEYLSSMARDMWPIRLSIVDSGTPFSANCVA